ncbi:MAG: hypothetical protein IT204_01150 [Fimbriimonadaceae bacterium]|nr:hypothetical protein [Fimbriimonadaceae bacterium]
MIQIPRALLELRRSRPRLLLAVAAVAFLISLASDPNRAWGSVLLAGYALCHLALSAAFMLAVSYPLGERGRDLRRVLLAMLRLLPYGAAAVLSVTLLNQGLYPWRSPAAHLSDFQRAWFLPGFFGLRALAYLAAWRYLAGRVERLVTARLAGDSPALRTAHARFVPLFCYTYALTVWLASYDWLMSLEAPWASTIYGLYAAAGGLLSAVAMLTLLVFSRRQLQPARVHLDSALQRDLGQWLFGLSCVWVYLWFSQFLLIWYVNLPEETGWLALRLSGAWGLLFYVNVGLNWVLPFLVLLLGEAKRNATVLGRIAVVLLVGRWLDLYLLIMPGVQPGGPHVGLPELAATLGAMGCLLSVVLPTLEREP